MYNSEKLIHNAVNLTFIGRSAPRPSPVARDQVRDPPKPGTSFICQYLYNWLLNFLIEATDEFTRLCYVYNAALILAIGIDISSCNWSLSSKYVVCYLFDKNLLCAVAAAHAPAPAPAPVQGGGFRAAVADG